MIQTLNKKLGRISRLASDLARLARPQNALYGALLSASAAVMAGAWRLAPACALVVFLLYAWAAAFNNMQDIETDKLNKRTDNPLTTRRIPPKVLRYFLFGIGAIILALQYVLTQPASIFVTLVYSILLIGYSDPRIRLQSRGFAATLTLCLCYGSLPFLLGALQHGIHHFLPSFLAAGFQIVLLFPLLLAKDYKDIKGDAATGKRTPLVQYGQHAVRRAAALTAITASVIYIAVAFRAHFDTILIVASAAFYVLFAYQIHSNKGVVSWQLSKLYTVVLLVMSLFISYTLLT